MSSGVSCNRYGPARFAIPATNAVVSFLSKFFHTQYPELTRLDEHMKTLATASTMIVAPTLEVGTREPSCYIEACPT